MVDLMLTFPTYNFIRTICMTKLDDKYTLKINFMHELQSSTDQLQTLWTVNYVPNLIRNRYDSY